MTIRLVCIHHTARPTEDEWVAKGGWPYWGPVLARYYRSLGWTAMPHVFAGPDGWHVLWPLDRDGRGVGGGYLEPGLRHIEIVGDHTDHLPTGATLANALDAAVTIQRLGGLGPEAITHHTAVVGPGVTECPGAMLIAHWDWFTGLVAEEWWRRRVTETITAARWHAEQSVREIEAAIVAQEAAVAAAQAQLDALRATRARLAGEVVPKLYAMEGK
jgi:hypothetical protein